jgi:hypothetical protein
MQKNTAIKLFGGLGGLRKALTRCGKPISPQAIYYWDDPLTQNLSDEIIGAAIRLRVSVPREVLKEHRDAKK